MERTNEELKTVATLIKSERNKKANTPARVGGLLEDIADSFVNGSFSNPAYPDLKRVEDVLNFLLSKTTNVPTPIFYRADSTQVTADSLLLTADKN